MRIQKSIGMNCVPPPDQPDTHITQKQQILPASSPSSSQTSNRFLISIYIMYSIGLFAFASSIESFSLALMAIRFTLNRNEMLWNVFGMCVCVCVLCATGMRNMMKAWYGQTKMQLFFFMQCWIHVLLCLVFLFHVRLKKNNCWRQLHVSVYILTAHFLLSSTNPKCNCNNILSTLFLLRTFSPPYTIIKMRMIQLSHVVTEERK